MVDSGRVLTKRSGAMVVNMLAIIVLSSLPSLWAAECALGFEPAPLVVAEREGDVVNRSACADACMKKTCKAFVFYSEARRCDLFVPHPGTQCVKSEEAERLPGPPEGGSWRDYLATAGQGWRIEPDISGGKCNTGGKVIKNLGWGKDAGSASLDKCQALCDKDVDCVGVSHLPSGGRIMDNIAVEMNMGVAENIGKHLLNFLADSKHRSSSHCETGPLSPPNLEQCINPVIQNNSCTLCYRIVTDCRQFSNGEDCTVFRTDADEGGVYLRPKVDCPKRAGIDSCSGDASCPIIAKGKCHANDCLCDDADAPCAQAVMGPQYVHGGSTHNKKYMDVPKNKPGMCVSKEAFCQIDNSFIDPKALEVAVLQSLLMTQNLMSSLNHWLTHLKRKDYPLVARAIITMQQSAKALSADGVPPAILFLKMFGIYQCYVDMLTSSSKKRGLEFAKCEVDATLRLVVYLSGVYSAGSPSMRGRFDGFVQSKEIERFKVTVEDLGKASQKSKTEEALDKIEEADTKSQKAAEKSGVDIRSSLSMEDFGIDTSSTCHDISKQIHSETMNRLRGRENLLIVTGTFVVTKAVEEALNVEHWASKQPFLNIQEPDGNGKQKLEMVITQHLDDGTHMLENMLTVALHQIEELLGRISADHLQHEDADACTTYPRQNPTPFCSGWLRHEHLVDVQFRDMHFTECRVKDAVEQYVNIAGKKDFTHIMKNHPVCENAVRDLTCLRAMPTCKDPCENLEPCKRSCENLNTCAKTLGLKEPYDCETECICMHGCYDLLETSMLTKEVGECSKVCMGRLRRKHENDFWYNLNNHDSMETRIQKESEQCEEECKYSPQQRVNMLCNHRETQQEAASQQRMYELLLLPKAEETVPKSLVVSLLPIVMVVSLFSGMAIARFSPGRPSSYLQVHPQPEEESQALVADGLS